MSNHDVVEVSSEEGTIDYPVNMQGSGGSAPVPCGSGGSAPVAKGGSAPVPKGGSAPISTLDLPDPDAETLLVHLNSGGSALVPHPPEPMAGSGGSAPGPMPGSSGLALEASTGGSAPTERPILSNEVRQFQEWMRGLQENVLDDLPRDDPSYTRASEYVQEKVRNCWVRFLAEYRWLRKDPRIEPRFWSNKTSMVAHEMYKEIFKDIGKMVRLNTRGLAKKVGYGAYGGISPMFMLVLPFHSLGFDWSV